MLVTGDYREALAEAGWSLSEQAKFIGKVKGGELVALAAFDNYNGDDIDVHIVANGFTRDWIRAICEYAFDLCQCNRMTSLNDAENFTMERYLDRLGFQYEGRKRKALPNGNDILIYGLIKEDCKWVGNQARG
jgi:RimJ/RimL family protein N-acetyltransferase